MWVTRSEREWRRREETRDLADTARRAEAHISGASNALNTVLADEEGLRHLAEAGLDRISLSRSSRLGRDGRAEALAVLEAVVVGGAVGYVLSNPRLVRWLSANYPKELASLNAISK